MLKIAATPATAAQPQGRDRDRAWELVLVAGRHHGCFFPEGRDKCAILSDFSESAVALGSPLPASQDFHLALRFCAGFGSAGGCCPMSLCSHWKAAGLRRRAAARSGFTLFVTAILHGDEVCSLTSSARSPCPALVMGWTLQEMLPWWAADNSAGQVALGSHPKTGCGIHPCSC